MNAKYEMYWYVMMSRLFMKVGGSTKSGLFPVFVNIGDHSHTNILQSSSGFGDMGQNMGNKNT